MEYSRGKKRSLKKLKIYYSVLFGSVQQPNPKRNQVSGVFGTFALFESCGNAGNQATPQSWKVPIKTIVDTLKSQDTFSV